MSTDHVRWSRRPSLDAPVVVAAFEGWNDAGDAATWAVRHLADRSDATPFADIDPEEFHDFSSQRPVVELDEGARRLVWPTTTFSDVTTARDLILVQGVEPRLKWRTFVEQILGVAADCGASTIVTLGALLAEVPHTRPVTVFGHSDDPDLGSRMALEPSSYEGPTGIVGVLNQAAKQAGFPALSLWAAVPNYVSGAASPKAALALVERLQDLLLTPIPVTELQIAASAYERQISTLIEDDDDTAAYIRTLEAQYDESDEPDGLGTSLEPLTDDEVDPDVLVEELEQFLRDQD